MAFHDIVTHLRKTESEVERFWNEIKSGYEYREFVERPPSGGVPVAGHLNVQFGGQPQVIRVQECDVFASSMVVMARAVGIPARYVTGFYPLGNERDEAGRFTVRERDAQG